MANRALDGLKVVEYGELVAGPYCAKLLADLGAETIKIEKPGGGDSARRRGPFPGDVPHLEKSGLFLWLNTNKLGITLDPHTSRGRELFKELANWADILITDKTQRMMEELQLDYERLRQLNPGLVLTSITPFGQTGPYKDYLAYPLNSFHSGGEGYITPGQSPWPERPPLKSGMFVGEYESAYCAAGATLCAHYYRELGGLGQMVDISKQEAMAHLQTRELYRATLGYVSTRATRGYKFAGPFPCKDGWVEFAPHRQQEWDAFLKVLGDPAWAENEQYRDVYSCEKHADEVKALLASLLKGFTVDEIAQLAMTNRIPIVPYYTLDKVVESPQLAARGFFVEVAHGEAGSFRYPSAPYRFSETPWAVYRPAPKLGEHNEEIYCQRLGYSKGDLVQLRQAGVI